MKKIIILVMMFLALLCLTTNVYATENRDTIRIRVIANSNHKSDQSVKKQIKEAIEQELVVNMNSAKDIIEATNLIEEKLPKINELVGNILIANNKNPDYKINFGMNYFPKKNTNNVTYPKGYYQSLVIKIGNAKGRNWWCILFPPLCLLEAKEQDKTEYRFFIEDLINKYFINAKT